MGRLGGGQWAGLSAGIKTTGEAEITGIQNGAEERFLIEMERHLVGRLLGLLALCTATYR